MSWFEHLLSSDLIYRMGYALFGSLWQGVLVALLLAGALAVIPRTKSSLRYWCGCIALFALPVLFCATAVLVGERANVMEPIVSETTTLAMDGTTIEKIDLSTSTGEAGRIDDPVAEAAADIDPAEIPTSATPWYSRLSDTVKPWTGHIVLCWFVGVFAMSVWNLGGWIAVRRLRCIGISDAPERFVAMLSELAGRLGVKHPVRLLQSAVVQSPMTIGWLKPVILVPASILCELSPEQIETILAHELAHIRRFDYLANLLQTVVETLLFHHPAVWWISHKIRSERECCCDDAVVKLTSDELNYAKALTAIADLRRDVPQLAVAAAGGSLLSRIQRILGLSNKKTLSGSTWLASLLALIICIAAAVSIVNAAAAPPRDAAAQKLIIGTWKSTTLSDHWADRYASITMTFFPDGSGKGASVYTDGRRESNDFTWKFDKRNILLGANESGDEPEAYRWNIRRNKLRLRDDKGDMVFARVEKIEPDDIESPIGTWDMIEGKGSYAGKFKSVTVVFDADGRWTLKSVDSKGQDREEGRYTFKGGRVWFRENDDVVIEFDAERMTMSEDNTTFTFKRRDDAETGKTQSIVGTWKSRQLTGEMAKDIRSITVIFRADGTAAIERFAARGDGKVVRDAAYKIIGNQIELIEDAPGEKPETIMWEMRGKYLLLGERDEMIEFERFDEDPENDQPDSVTFTDVVGHWEMVEIVGKNDDDIVSMELIFSADGSWNSVAKGPEGSGFVDEDRGTYTIQNGKLTFVGHPDVQLGFDGKRLTAVEQGVKIIFEKKQGDTIKAESLIGTWEMIEVTGENASDAVKGTWTFNPDGTLVAEGTDAQGKSHIQTSAYTFKNGRISVAVSEDVVITIAGDLLTAIGANTKAVFRKKTPITEASSSSEVDITPYVGSWRAEEVWDDGVKKDDAMNIELHADGTCSFLVLIDGVPHTDSATYSVKGNRIIFKGGRELDPSTIAVLEGDTLTISGSGDRAVLKKYEPRISTYVGSWLIAEQGIMTVHQSGLVTMQPFDGDAEQGMIVHSKDGKPILRNGDGEYSIKVSGDLLLMKETGDAGAGEHPLKRIMVDERFVGSWKSKEFTGSIDKQITALFLKLKDDSTFTLLGEGEDAGKPIKGFYQTDGDILTLSAQSSDEVAMDFIKSARYDSPTIRLAIGGGAAVMTKVVHNPFDGAEHPMFRAMLTSTESQSGQIWLDLDTGNSVAKDQWEHMTKTDKSMYELTLDKGTGLRIQLTLASDSARLLPNSRHSGDFQRHGIEIVKLLPSLKKSKLRTTDYKGGIFLAVLTDRGRLAVVEMMTPTADDETPLGWSLAEITQTDGNEPQVNVLTQTDPVEKEAVEIKSRRVTIPDADTKNVPTILDLAGGEMLQIPDESEGVDLIGHFTKLGKGDLLFDRLFAVLRGGSAQIWKDGQWTLLTPEDRQVDATAYKLPESLPCRLLITTGDGKQFDVNALARTTDGGLEIEYKPVGDKVTVPGKEGAHSSIHTMEYTVKPGDTLAKIVETVYGVPGSYKEIMKINNLSDADSLTVGMVLKMPKDVASSFHIARAFIEALKLKDHAAAMMLCKPGTTEASASAKLVQTFDFTETNVEQAFESPRQAMAVAGPVKTPDGQTAKLGITMEPVAGGWQIRDFDFLPQGKAKTFVGDFQTAFPDARSTWPKD